MNYLKLNNVYLSAYVLTSNADSVLSDQLELSTYMHKNELSNYLSVVDEEPSVEQQAANPQVIWFVKKR